MGAGPQTSDDLPMAEINVTPFVDVMLVLLIIFMVTVPMMDQGVQLELPKSKGASLEASSESQLVLKILKDRTLRLNNKKMSLQRLKEKLPLILKRRKDKTLFVRADKKVRYGFVAYVVGEVRQAGVKKLGLVTLPLDEP